MKTLFMTCCHFAVIDQRSNNLSVINMIEELQSPTYPFVFPKLTIVILSERTPEEDSVIETRLEARIGADVVFDVIITLEFEDKKRCRSIAELQGLIIPNPGELIITHKFDENELARWSITTTKVGAPEVDLFNRPEGGEG